MNAPTSRLKETPASLQRRITIRTPAGRRLVALLQAEFGAPAEFTFLKVDIPVNGPIEITAGTLPKEPK